MTSPSPTTTTPPPRAKAVAFEQSTCRACLRAGCVHCDRRGYFTRRLYRRALPAQRRESSAVRAFLAS